MGWLQFRGIHSVPAQSPLCQLNLHQPHSEGRWPSLIWDKSTASGLLRAVHTCFAFPKGWGVTALCLCPHLIALGSPRLLPSCLQKFNRISHLRSPCVLNPVTTAGTGALNGEGGGKKTINKPMQRTLNRSRLQCDVRLNTALLGIASEPNSHGFWHHPLVTVPACGFGAMRVSLTALQQRKGGKERLNRSYQDRDEMRSSDNVIRNCLFIIKGCVTYDFIIFRAIASFVFFLMGD